MSVGGQRVSSTRVPSQWAAQTLTALPMPRRSSARRPSGGPQPRPVRLATLGDRGPAALPQEPSVLSISVLNTGQAEPAQEADIYALGASLLISATGWRAVEYPDDAPRPVQRGRTNGRRRPVKVPESRVDWSKRCSAERPTIYEVGKALI